MTKRIQAEVPCRDCGEILEGHLGGGRRRCMDCILAIMRAHFLEPLEPYPGAAVPWLCRCLQCGNEVTPRFGNITSGSSNGCRPCGIANRASQCRLSAEEAEASAQAAGLKPLEPYQNVDTPWLSECQACGTQVTPTLRNIRNGHHGCKYCVGRGLDPRKMEILAREAGVEPLTNFPGPIAPWPCRCLRCGRDVSPRLKSLRSGNGCRYCDAGAIDPEVAVADLRQKELEPLDPFPGCTRPWRCRCLRCGQEVAPTYSDIQRGWRGCRDCGYRSRAIAQDVAVALMRSAEMEPQEPYRNANAPWRCRCMKCGREGTPTYGQIQQGWGGCRWCQTSGFRVADPGIIYLAVHPGYDAVKVGIANDPDGRLRIHKARGWETVLVVHGSGEAVLAAEVATLEWWRNDLGLAPYLSRAELPQGGWTETVAAAEIDLAATMRRVRESVR